MEDTRMRFIVVLIITVWSLALLIYYTISVRLVADIQFNCNNNIVVCLP